MSATRLKNASNVSLRCTYLAQFFLSVWLPVITVKATSTSARRNAFLVASSAVEKALDKPWAMSIASYDFSLVICDQLKLHLTNSFLTVRISIAGTRYSILASRVTRGSLLDPFIFILHTNALRIL